LWLIAAEEEDALGPATESEIRNGRIPLRALTKANLPPLGGERKAGPKKDNAARSES
jgi:hypothetical protein